MIDIPAARAIIAGATPGEWVARHDQDCDGYCYIERVDDRDPVGNSYHWHDATFIAAAREGWPAALDEAERLAFDLKMWKHELGERTCERDEALAELATLRAALVEACDSLAVWMEDYDALCEAIRSRVPDSERPAEDPSNEADHALIARLRALAAGGAG